MHKDYIDAVVREYHDMVSTNKISFNLFPLTPGNVKKECKIAFRKHLRRDDERLLTAFFGHAENVTGYLHAIARCDIDKFKPMINFVEGRSKETDPKNIELLAWLIDFKKRPFDPNGPYGKLKPQSLIGGQQEGNGKGPDSSTNREQTGASTSDQPGGLPEEKSNVGSVKSWEKKEVLIIALVVGLLAGTMGYFGVNGVKPVNKISNNEFCMYRKDDHYERISCDQKVSNSKVIALNTDILNNFRKINVPDTITYNSIGKVWYSKIKGKLEYYTSMGYHPVLTQLPLKPLTKYMIDTHIRKKTLSNEIVTSSSTATHVTIGQQIDFNLLSKPLETLSWSTYGQCQAITKAKTQCSRKASRGGFCWQHKKQGA